MSVLSTTLFAVHWIDEVARGLEPGTPNALGGIVILVVWLYAAVVLGDTLPGYLLMLLGGILGVGVLVLHMQGTMGLVGRRIANTPGVFLWVGTLISLGVTSAMSAILSLHALWHWRRRRST